MATPRDPRGRDRSWERWALGTGVLFVVLALIGFLIAPDPPGADASNAEVIDYFSDKEGEVRFQALLFALAGAALLWFTGTFAALLRRWLAMRTVSEDDNQRLPAIVVASGAAAIALYTAGTAAYTALATRAGEEIDEATGRVLFELGGSMLTFTTFPAAVFVLAGSFGIMRTLRLPDWLAWLGMAVAVVLTLDGIGAAVGDSDTFGPSGPIGIVAFLSFQLWVLATSGLLTWKRWDVGDVDRASRAAP